MGHSRLWRLQKTHRWKEVLALLTQNASEQEIAEASLYAIELALGKAPKDDGFTSALTTIFEFVEAIRSKDAEHQLLERGFAVPKDGVLLDYLGSLQDRIDIELRTEHAASDLGELAAQSFSEVVAKYGSTQAELFSVDSETSRELLRNCLSGKNFQQVMHDYFATFTRRYLLYNLSRELPLHAGPDRHFDNIDKQSQFHDAFDLFVRQTVRITDEFTPGWFDKAKYEGRVSRQEVRKFAHVAFKKIRSEIRRGSGPSDER